MASRTTTRSALHYAKKTWRKPQSRPTSWSIAVTLSEKDPALQPAVARNVSEQIVGGNQSVIGLMLESHLEAGNQAIPDDLSALRYSVSVTDDCIDWATTESLILELSEATAAALKVRAA